jgi:ATP-dependent RNA helicase RhlE
VIHGNRSQNQRISALEGFREGEHRVLVATDIAARGIDVEGVSHVVNFDVPHESEVYVHRVGRTARAQRRGDAYTLVSPEEMEDLRHIEKLIGFEIPRARIPGFVYDAPAPPRPEGVPSGRPPRSLSRGGRSNRPRDRSHRPPERRRPGGDDGNRSRPNRRTYRRW